MNLFKKLFQPRHDLTSYSPSLLRLLLGAAAIALSIAAGKYCSSLHPASVRFVCSALRIFVGLCGTFQLYMVMCEISFIADNRKTFNAHALSPEEIRALPHKHYSIEELMEIVDRDPFLELSIIFRDRLIYIDIDSDSRIVYSNLFVKREEYFDKRFSIDNSEYAPIQNFPAALLSYCENGQIAVHEIDEVVQE